MINHNLYEQDISTILKSQTNNITIPRTYTATLQKTLLVSIVHMLLGLPSQTFPLHSNSFKVDPNFPGLQHLSRIILFNQLDNLIKTANQLQLVRSTIRNLRVNPERLLQAFGIGLYSMQIQIEQILCRELVIIHQEEGKIARNQEELMQSQKHPCSLLAITKKLAIERGKLKSMESILSLLPNLEVPNTLDLQRCCLFLLNFYTHQCKEAFLTGKPFLFHTPFRSILKEYMQICKAWVSFSVAPLQAYAHSPFFIDISKALSVDDQRFFQMSKVIRDEWVPEILSKSYKRVVQLGKTVQFIKKYFNEEELLFFDQFMDFQNEFKQIQDYLTDKNLPQNFSRKNRIKQNTTISSRCNRKQKKIVKPQQPEDNPYQIFLRQNPFFHLRSDFWASFTLNTSVSDVQTPQIIRKEDSTQEFVDIVDETLQRLALKCKIILKEERIKESIWTTLRGIKQFVLLGQGDFVQQFLQISVAALSKAPDRINRNSMERIIQEAIKSSAAAPLYESLRETLSFVFLNREHRPSKSWNAFAFTYKSEVPVNYIFNLAAMQEYESVGNLLFNLRRCEYILVNFWRKSLLAGSRSLMQTRIAIQRFVACLQTLLFTEIEQFWNNLLIQYESCSSVIALMRANQSFLSQLKELTTQNKAVSNSLLSLGKIVERFQSLGQQLENHQSIAIDSEVQQIWSWFLSMLDQAKSITKLNGTFDFNFGSPF